MINPIAQYGHSAFVRQHQVEQYVSMSEYEVLYVIILDVFLGKSHKRLALFATEVFFFEVVVLLAT